MIESKIKEIIHGITHNELGLNSSTLLKEIKMDSLDTVQVIVAIEQEYDIEITDDAVMSFHTWGCRFLRRKQGKGEKSRSLVKGDKNGL